MARRCSWARSTATWWTRARSSRREYVLPAIKANALYGGGYPLFTALGRPLIAKLAVDVARESGCDTIAHGCTGKGNDQVRIEATVLALAPELKIIAPVRGWRMGREEEIAYARKHGIPVKGGTEAPPYSIDDNLWGRSSEGGPIEDLDEPPHDDVFQLVTPPEDAPDQPEDLVLEFERGRPVALDGERLGLVELLERAGEMGARHGVGIVDHVEDRIVGLKVRDLYEVPAAAIDLARAQGAREARGHDPPEQLQAAARPPLGLPGLRGPLVRAAAGRPERVHGLGERAGHGLDHHAALQGHRPAPVARRSPNALYDQALAGFGESGGLFSQQASPGFIELWTLQSRMAYAIRNREERRSMNSRDTPCSAGSSWQIGIRVAKRKMAQNRVKLGAARHHRARARGRHPRRARRRRRVAAQGTSAPGTPVEVGWPRTPSSPGPRGRTCWPTSRTSRPLRAPAALSSSALARSSLPRGLTCRTPPLA